MNYLCFDIGGTNIKYGILDSNYNIIEKSQKATNAYLGGEYILNELLSIINIYKDKYTFNGIAISTAGVVDYLNGSIIYANDIIPNYTGLKLAEILNQKTGLKISVENDVKCFALSHILSNNSDFLMVAIGTGIGGAIVINKLVLHGLTNSAGEFGQMLINNEKFESAASVSSLVRNAIKLGLDVKSGVDVFRLYDDKNSLAIQAVTNFYKNLSYGLVNLGYIFNFPKIILGGGITNRKAFLNELYSEVEKIADKEYFKSTIEVSPNTNDGGMIGALVHFKNLYER